MPTCPNGLTATIQRPTEQTTTSVEKKITLQIYSYISGKRYDFEAYIYSFSFDINSTIEEQLPFGRSSRIFTYGGTSRGDIKIDFFELVNSHVHREIEEAYIRTSRIIKEMYPQYGWTGGSLSLNKAPLFRIYSPAYISNGNVDTDDDGTDASKNGLPMGVLGYIKTLRVSFDRSTDGAFGHYMGGSGEGTYAALTPKINYSMTFAPIDDFAPGFDSSGEWSSDAASWPMGFESGIEKGQEEVPISVNPPASESEALGDDINVEGYTVIPSEAPSEAYDSELAAQANMWAAESFGDQFFAPEGELSTPAPLDNSIEALREAYGADALALDVEDYQDFQSALGTVEEL